MLKGVVTMKQWNILFDLDDTLIPTQEVYNETKSRAVDYVYEKMNGSITRENILKHFEEVDKQNFTEYGLSKERFPTSWVKTLKKLKETTKKEENELYAIGQTVFQTVISPFEEAIEVLNELKEKGYSLSLLTAGDVTVQEKRIKDANLSSYFQHIYILPVKTPQTVAKQLGKSRLEHTVMIGNSLRSDIYPALALGMKAIHIERETWGYDSFDINKEHENYYSTVLQKVPQIIEKIEDLTKNDIFFKNEKDIIRTHRSL